MAKKKLKEVVSIKTGSLAGGMASSELDKDKRKHHPYYYAKKAFARSRDGRDIEQEVETSEEQLEIEKAPRKKIDMQRLIEKYVAATIDYGE